MGKYNILMTFRLKHAMWDQNLQFTRLSETTNMASLHFCKICYSCFSCDICRRVFLVEIKFLVTFAIFAKFAASLRALFAFPLKSLLCSIRNSWGRLVASLLLQQSFLLLLRFTRNFGLIEGLLYISSLQVWTFTKFVILVILALFFGVFFSLQWKILGSFAKFADF